MKHYHLHGSTNSKNACFAGTADGLATLDGKPIAREIVLFRADNLQIVYHGASFASGHYMVQGLDSDTQYLLMIRDYEQDKEPYCYDYIKPSTELTVAEQAELWQSWQDK
ncbi:MAG: hypothetical protein CSA10_00015 [Cardiobacteriales bacterium]|nr:MAG: hypothetical protein CSA10_00015 [Cardiobacteriales bacterium]